MTRPQRPAGTGGASLGVAIALASLLLIGCAGPGGGELAMRSQSEAGTRLEATFTGGVYRYDSDNAVTVVLTDHPETPRQIVTIRMFWAPQIGRTPLDRRATNAIVHYVILAGDEPAEAGVYSGAGFFYPRSTPGEATLRGSLRQSVLRLADRSAGFRDMMGKAELDGRFVAIRDDGAVQEKLRALQVTLRRRLGYPRLVEAADTPGRPARPAAAGPVDSRDAG